MLVKPHRGNRSPQDKAARIALAREIEAEIKALLKASRTAEARIAALVVRLKKDRLYKALGKFSTLAAYCYETLGWGESKTAKIVAMAGKLPALPHLRAVFESGEACWSNVYEASTIATPERDAEWADKVRRLTLEKLQQEIAREKKQAPKARISFTAPAELKALFLQIVDAIRGESKKPMDVATAFAEILRRATRGGEGVAKPLNEIVIHYCPTCETATRQSRDGRVVVSKTEFERDACAMKVRDATSAPSEDGTTRKVSRHTPEDIRRFIEDRDRHCRFPGCNETRNLEIHHEGGWLNTDHHPEKCYLACWAHHGGRHDEDVLVIELGPGLYSFCTADGDELGTLDISLSAEIRERFEKRLARHKAAPAPNAPAPLVAPSTPATPSTPVVPAAPTAKRAFRTEENARAVEDATKALVSLQFKRSEAAALVQKALMTLPEAARTAEAIVGAALRALPAPRSAG